MLTVTENAVQYLNKQAEGYPDQTPYLIVGLKKYGCSGWGYEFLMEEHDFINITSGYELSVSPEWDFIIAVSSEYASIISGGIIDYRKVDSFNTKLTLDIPKANEFCGCGESFTITDGE